MRTNKSKHHAGMFVGFFGCMLLLTSGSAADWPQWQGPDRNAISKETGLLKEWPKEGPALAWKAQGLGGGDGAPSVAAGSVYGMANRDTNEIVWARSETDGKELWVTLLGPAFNQRVPQSKEGPSCTPTVDGERLYVEGLTGDVTCLQAKDGKILWQRSLQKDFGGRLPMWSYRESPLIDGDKVIVTSGNPDALLVALNKLTGETIWKSQGSSNNVPESQGARPEGSSQSPAAGVTGTKDPGLFTSEHFGMRSFSSKIPNGKYLAKLYFAETYQGITASGQRVFSMNIQGHEIKDFDVWAKAGGPRRAYVETVPVEVTDGEFRVSFTPQVENPAISAIEIIPQTDSAANTNSNGGAIRVKAGASTAFTDSNGQVWQPDKGFEGGMVSQVGAGFGGAPGGMGGGGRGPGGFGGFGGGSAGAAYASPIAIDFGGLRQYVQFAARGVIGVSSADGKFLWRYDKPANGMGINCSTPIYHDGMVFAAAAYGAGGGLAKLSKDENGGIKADEVWFSKKMQNHHGGVIIHDGCVYGANGGNEGGALVCLDLKTGNVLWDEKNDAERRAPKGSLALADGRLYYRTEKGTVLLIEPSAKEYIERGRFEQPDRTGLPAWAHPVVANGKLYIRDQDTLFCYDVKAR